MHSKISQFCSLYHLREKGGVHEGQVHVSVVSKINHRAALQLNVLDFRYVAPSLNQSSSNATAVVENRSKNLAS